MPELFPATEWDPSSGTISAGQLNFFDELSTGAWVSARGNTLVGDFPLPVSPLKADGGVDRAFLTNYLAKALARGGSGLAPDRDCRIVPREISRGRYRRLYTNGDGPVSIDCRPWK